jgi:hypothetical protein
MPLERLELMSYLHIFAIIIYREMKNSDNEWYILRSKSY